MTLLDLLKNADIRKQAHESGESSGDSANEDDSSNDSELNPDLTDIDDMIVYQSVIPDNLSMSLGMMVTDFKAYFTPSLVDEVIVSSCLNVD